MTNQIDSADYRDIKSDYGETLVRLQAKYSGLNTDQDDIEKLLNQGIENLFRIHSIYDNSEFVACRDLIGPIYPENLIYDGIGFRTTRINEAVQLMYLINEQLDQNKKETNQNISNLSLMVGDEGFEPNKLNPHQYRVFIFRKHLCHESATIIISFQNLKKVPA